MRSAKALRPLFLALLTAFACTAGIVACKHPVPDPPADSGYPEEIANIFINKCAGCHNEVNAPASGGLRMDTWDQLFKGGSGGAVVIPYDNIENSVLLHFINTDPARGHVAEPTMPLNAPPLSADEYHTIRKWIAAGAPDKNGTIPFASFSESRQKLYVTTQGCDLLAVVDAERNVIMRYLPIGDGAQVEAPHCVRVSADGRYAYVCFTAGDYLYKIDTRTDQIVGSANIRTTPGSGGDGYNVLNVSQDGSKVAVVGLNSKLLRIVNTADMSVGSPIKPDPSKFSDPHGIVSTPNFDTFYVTLQEGNQVWRITPTKSPFFKTLTIDENPATLASSRDPHEILMAPDNSKFFVTCQKSNEVRIISTATGTLMDAINVGVYPQEMAVSKTQPYLFVSCMEDPTSSPQSKGSVYVINYKTHQVVAKLEGDMYQPHGISVDDQRGRVYIMSRNIDVNGPTPHHTGSCGGRNGFYTVYNLNTLERINNRRYEIAVDPYGAAMRFW